MTTEAARSPHSAPRLDPSALRDLIADGSGPRLLDVRTPAEFQTAHIPGSYNVPLDTLREHRAELMRHLDEDAVLICRSGNRAAQAERALAEAGLPNLRVLDGGITAWEAAGAPVTRGRPRWDLERQVRLVAGSIVLISGLAGLFVPGLHLIGTAVGAGLAFAALSNTCAMGMLLAKLPYNRGPRTDIEAVLAALGGGGSILTVPILVYLAGMEAKEAIATSLFVVGVTSVAGTISHARAGRVRWRTGLLFGAAGMAGAYGGGRLAAYIPGTVLLIAFGLMMLATAAAMIRGRKAAPPGDRRELPVAHVLLEGIAVGLVTGLVGAGGGFLVVPALALLGGLPMGVAVGTSLLVIALKSFAGLAGYLSSVQIDWRLALLVTAAAVVGSIAGGRLAGRIPQDALRKAFGWFVVTMGVFVLVQQLSPAIRHTVLTSPATWVVLAAAVLTGALAVGRHLHRRPVTAGRRPEEQVEERAGEPELPAPYPQG